MDGTLVFRPNTVVMGQAAWSVIRRHPVLVNAIRGNLTEKGLISREEFQELFEIQKLLIGSSYVNTAKEGPGRWPSRCWGKHVACLYINPDATTQEGITFGLTAQFGTRTSAGSRIPTSAWKAAIASAPASASANSSWRRTWATSSRTRWADHGEGDHQTKAAKATEPVDPAESSTPDAAAGTGEQPPATNTPELSDQTAPEAGAQHRAAPR